MRANIGSGKVKMSWSYGSVTGPVMETPRTVREARSTCSTTCSVRISAPRRERLLRQPLGHASDAAARIAELGLVGGVVGRGSGAVAHPASGERADQHVPQALDRDARLGSAGIEFGGWYPPDLFGVGAEVHVVQAAPEPVDDPGLERVVGWRHEPGDGASDGDLSHGPRTQPEGDLPEQIGGGQGVLDCATQKADARTLAVHQQLVSEQRGVGLLNVREAGVQLMRAAVERAAAHHRAPGQTTELRLPFEHEDLRPTAGQARCCREPRDPSSEHQHTGRFAHGRNAAQAASMPVSRQVLAVQPSACSARRTSSTFHATSVGRPGSCRV